MISEHIVRTWLARLVPRAKDRRALGAGCALIGSLLFIGRGVPAWRQWEQNERLAIQESTRRLDGAWSSIRARRSIAVMRGVLTRRLDSLSSAYLHASSVAVAGAALATLTGDLGDESGVRVTSTSVRADSSTTSAFTRVAVRISATGDVEGLADYLRSIESYEQLLAVRELSVAQTDPGAPDSRVESLRFEVLVEGLAQIDAKARASTPSGRDARFKSLGKE